MYPNEINFGSELPLSNEAVQENLRHIPAIVKSIHSMYKNVKGIKNTVMTLKYAEAWTGLKTVTGVVTAAESKTQDCVGGLNKQRRSMLEPLWK